MSMSAVLGGSIDLRCNLSIGTLMIEIESFRLTLALLEDSGWYYPDYSRGESYLV